MNTRDYKIFRKGDFYHVYNRGDNREALFIDDQDYSQFLIRLKITLGFPIITKLRMKPLPQNSFTIVAYCLMPNHYHLLIKQESDIPIGELVKRISTSYAKYLNAKYKRVGNIFQDTFKSKHVDTDKYITYLSAYIHNNPSNPFDYPHSSLPEYLESRSVTLSNPNFILSYFNNDPNKYRKFVKTYSHKDHEQIKHLTFDED